MKKKILILAACLFTAMSAQAANWLNLETENPNLKLFIDMDSIEYVTNDICFYSIIFTKGKEPTKVAYIKANKADNTLGVIKSGDYIEAKYNPRYVFDHMRVFMRPLEKDSFLAVAQDYASCYSAGEVLVNNKNKKNVKKNIKKVKAYEPVADYKTYMKLLREDVVELWNPPKSGRNTQTEVIFTVASDGSLYGYNIVKSSGHESTDRSVISALELAAPYRPLPQNIDSLTDKVNMKLNFSYKYVKKEVK